MASRTFPLVRGRKMRVTRLDGCGRPQYGDCNQVVTEGFVSVGLTANVTEGESITVTNANGKTCVSDTPCAEFNGYSAELTFCNVDPELFAMLSGQEQVIDANGDVVGFRMSQDKSGCDYGFALEVWAGVPGQVCSNDPNAQGAYGYILLPFMQGGVLGDFTIENAAINFSITGAGSKAGSTWGVGPYDVTMQANNQPGPLLKPIARGDHLHVQYTEVAPPDDTDGCFPVLNPEHTAITDFTATPAGLTVTVAPTPSTPSPTTEPLVVLWGDGSHTFVNTAGPITHAYSAAGTYKVTVQRGRSSVTKDVTVATP
jgi:hypothetical protein